MEEMSFNIPNDEPTVILALAQSVPTNWSQLSGKLSAPKELIQAGRVHAGIGFHIHPCGTITTASEAQNRGRNHWQEKAVSDFLFQPRLPAFIEFDSTHKLPQIGRESIPPFLLETAIAAIREGYDGELMFHLKAEDGEGLWMLAGCRIFFHRQENKKSEVRLSWWETADVHSRSRISTIEMACENLGLKQNTPTSRLAQAAQ